MHHPFVWFLVGFLALRIAVGIRLRRAGWLGHGPCGRGHRRWRRRQLRLMMRQHGFGFGAMPFAPPVVLSHWARQGAPAIDYVQLLELNRRQREIFEEAIAHTGLRGAELAEAMSLVGREPFDRRALEFLTGSAERADELEYLHDCLTPEQRARLREPSRTDAARESYRL